MAQHVSVFYGPQFDFVVESVKSMGTEQGSNPDLIWVSVRFNTLHKQLRFNNELDQLRTDFKVCTEAH